MTAAKSPEVPNLGFSITRRDLFNFSSLAENPPLESLSAFHLQGALALHGFGETIEPPHPVYLGAQHCSIRYKSPSQEPAAPPTLKSTHYLNNLSHDCTQLEEHPRRYHIRPTEETAGTLGAKGCIRIPLQLPFWN